MSPVLIFKQSPYRGRKVVTMTINRIREFLAVAEDYDYSRVEACLDRVYDADREREAEDDTLPF